MMRIIWAAESPKEEILLAGEGVFELSASIEGLARAAGKADLLILEMPDDSDFASLRGARAATRAPIIVIFVPGKKSRLQEALEAGATISLKLPLASGELVAALERCVSAHVRAATRWHSGAQAYRAITDITKALK